MQHETKPKMVKKIKKTGSKDLDEILLNFEDMTL
jgi:hypothetical protein